MNAISNLWNGRIGLPKTYWLWGVLSGIPWALALSLVTPGSNLATIALLAFVAYYVIVHVGIWRAASQYQGAKVWGILSKIAVTIMPACLVIGIIQAIALPAYQLLEKRAAISTNAPLELPDEGGVGVELKMEHDNAVANYRERIRAGEVHVFDSSPTMYLHKKDKEWPKKEVSKIGFLWWYENDYIYMIITNNHPRIAIRKIILGANHGACGTTAQTLYPVDLNVDIQPAHFAAVRLSNDALFRFAYQISGKLNEEEQKRWASDRRDYNDCLTLLNAWFSNF